jgi:hypothetical protein
MLLTPPKWSQAGVVPVQLIAALAVAAAAFGAGWTVQGWRGSAALAALQAKHTEYANAAQRLAEANARHLVRVWERGDELATSLASQQSRITQLHQEHTREINRLTTGRACLSAELVGVLNRTQPAPTDGPDALPTTTGSPASAHAGAFATDADVGTWAATARQQYAECAARLGSLIQWHVPRAE